MDSWQLMKMVIILKLKLMQLVSDWEKKIKIDFKKTPFFNITWKVEKDLSGIDESSKKGHDYAARVFVIKKTGITALSK